MKENCKDDDIKRDDSQHDSIRDHTTHFGYQEIPTHEKDPRVKQVFDSVAHQYDLMNDLMSLGLHRLWKQLAISKCAIRPHHALLDLAGGTGDLTLQFAKQVGPQGQLVLADINANMLEQGRARLVDAGVVSVQITQVTAESLPFLSDHFHCISMAFGLRNVTHKAVALQEMFRVLKPGGRVVILEFSKFDHPILSKFYDFYSFSVLPLLGKMVCQDAASYQYLAESIRKHPDQESLKSMMQTAGFERVTYQNIQGGIVALHIGFKL